MSEIKTKITIIGTGNVGGLTGFLIAQKKLAKEILLLDVNRNLAKAKAYDIEDALYILKTDILVEAVSTYSSIKGSSIVIITAGFVRQKDMTREDLLVKNATIIKDIAKKVSYYSPHAKVIIITNPVDIMAYLFLNVSNFKREYVLGMGSSLDSSRFANLIRKRISGSFRNIRSLVIGNHGKKMLPLTRLSKINKISINKTFSPQVLTSLKENLVQRGSKIISLLNTSAYFAPAVATVEIVESILKDRKRIITVSAYLDGEYNQRGLCIGVPARIGKEGIEKIIILNLNSQEKALFNDSIEHIKKEIKRLFSLGYV